MKEISIERKPVVKSGTLQFVLTGFTHDKLGFRIFSFDRIGEDRVRTKCTVRADLALIRQHGIHIQELPLLCRALLDRRDDAEEMPSLTFTGAEMLACMTERAAAREAAGTRRKAPPRPTGENQGAAWRGQHT